ncbi:MAG: hypothetical protein WA624_10235 [Methylocella sp.]
MDTRIVALTAVIFSLASRQCQKRGHGPALASRGFHSSAGFGLVFSDDFTNPQTIDLTATGNAGFNPAYAG